ncbi:hypothetical protein, partial [Rhodoplanes serenus]|uniref:hypothetical protein n=1 Tax=Rhodoplanes serenus TaxID=200615 RepID=UPI000DBBEA58
MLILVFLITIATGAAVQIRDNHRQATAAAAHEIELIAALLAERLERIARTAPPTRLQDEISALIGA